MKTLTKDQMKIVDEINSMDHRAMCKMWRFHEAGHEYFNITGPYAKIFRERLFKHFGGFTPEISKSIGWDK